jgi:hypothetical protein
VSIVIDGIGTLTNRFLNRAAPRQATRAADAPHRRGFRMSGAQLEESRIAVIGAGAIGGMVAVRPRAIRTDGHGRRPGCASGRDSRERAEALHHDGAEEHVRNVSAVASCGEAGTQDLVFLALKAYVLEAVAPQMPALFGDDTIVVPLQNGLPWWYFQNFRGACRLPLADGGPERTIETTSSPPPDRLRRLSGQAKSPPRRDPASRGRLAFPSASSTGAKAPASRACRTR